MNIILIGDSHIGALSRGFRALRARDALFKGTEIRLRQMGGGHILPTPFFTDQGDYAKITDPLFMKSFRQLPPAARRFDTIGLSMPLWPLRVMYKVVTANMSMGSAVEGRQPISNALFKRLVLEDQMYVIKLIEILNRSGTRVIAISPPALFRDHPILKYISIAEAKLMFDTYQRVMTEILSKNDVEIINVPACCLDDEGLMLPEYKHEDPTDTHHANSKFGELIIQDVERWLQSNPLPSPSGVVRKPKVRKLNKKLSLGRRILRRIARIVR